MSLYSARTSFSIVKDKTRSWYLGGHVDYLTDSTAKLCQGGKGRYVGRVSKVSIIVLGEM